MKQLTMERAALRDAWEKRSKQLKQCSELQVCKDTFNQAPMDAFNLGVPLIVSVSSNFDQPVQHATEVCLLDSLFKSLLPPPSYSLSLSLSLLSCFYEMQNKLTQQQEHKKPFFPMMTLE